MSRSLSLGGAAYPTRGWIGLRRFGPGIEDAVDMPPMMKSFSCNSLIFFVRN
jgi:hypothetical protein